MGLNEEGYLSSDISAYSQEIRARNAEYFKVFDKVHRFCHEKKFLVQPHNRDGQHVLAVGLSVKLICDVEAAVILDGTRIVVPVTLDASGGDRDADKAREYLQGV